MHVCGVCPCMCVCVWCVCPCMCVWCVSMHVCVVCVHACVCVCGVCVHACVCVSMHVCVCVWCVSMHVCVWCVSMHVCVVCVHACVCVVCVHACVCGVCPCMCVCGVCPCMCVWCACTEAILECGDFYFLVSARVRKCLIIPHLSLYPLHEPAAMTTHTRGESPVHPQAHSHSRCNIIDITCLSNYGHVGGEISDGFHCCAHAYVDVFLIMGMLGGKLAMASIAVRMHMWMSF